MSKTVDTIDTDAMSDSLDIEGTDTMEIPGGAALPQTGTPDVPQLCCSSSSSSGCSACC